MNSRRFGSLLFALALCSLGTSALTAQHLIVSNPVPLDTTAVVEIPVAELLHRTHIPAEKVNQIVAVDANTGKRIATQLYSSKEGQAADLLLLLLETHGSRSERVTFHLDPNPVQQDRLVFGREAAERKDDFAWENQLVTYRVYGPALQATGEITSGIDVWSKRVPSFVIDSFYQRDLEGSRTHNPALSYHKDNGQGLDSYEVGPSRGCGGTAVLAGGKLQVSKNYTKMRILANGPIRFQFELTYASWPAGGVSVSETKRITLDAGTHLNKIESTYTFDGGSNLELVAGLAVHAGASVTFPVQNQIASVWDTPQLASAGRIATGLVVASDQRSSTVQADGHALAVFKRGSGEPFTYYAGSGWSKADMHTPETWNEYLKTQLNLLEHPLVVRWTR